MTASYHLTMKIFIFSTNIAMPDPPEEFINLSSPSYCAQRYTSHNEPVNATTNIKTGRGVSPPAVTERKLVPILKTPPTLPRSNYSSEGNGNNN